MIQLYHLINSTCEVVLPVVYFAAVASYGQAFFRDDQFAEKWKSKLLRTSVIIHALYIGIHTMEYRRCMVTTPFEIMSLVAFTIIGTYWFIEYKTAVRETGFFAIGIAFIFLVISSVMMRDGSEPNALLKNLTVGIHISSATFGLGAITISAIYGMLYLLLYRNIKSGRFGMSYKHLPSLEALEKLSTYATIVGFFFLTIAMVLGYLTLPRAFQNFSYYDPKLIVTLLIWIVYGLALFAHFVIHIEGRRIMLLSLSGFVMAMFSWTITNAFLSGFHKFY